MPINSASGSTCTINLLQPNAIPNKLPCREYLHRSTRDPTTGAIQEIVTIESQHASPFEILLDIKPNIYLLNHPTTTNASSSSNPIKFQDFVYWFHLDGIKIGWTYSIGPGPHLIDVPTISSDDFSSYRALQFAPLNLVDPDDHPDRGSQNAVCEDEKVVKSLGTIRVDIFRANLVREPFRVEDHRHDHAHDLQTTNQMDFSERSKKALLSTTAGLTQHSIPDPSPPPESTWEVDEKEKDPFLQFIFKYKPRAILEAKGTIPRAAGPADSSSRSGKFRHVDVDDDEISIVESKPTTKEEEKKPNLRENPIEIKSDSESEAECKSKSEERAQNQEERKKNKRIKIVNKQIIKKPKTDTKPDPKSKSRSTSDRKPVVVDLQGTVFLDLTGSDDDK
ncbi:hypothetical protein PGT21_035336 [Puccinia graminis f. sp. tritici]|uniref:DUF7918 domain-containing protein n=1 Tax=Puccinia graminis f. sp. tritici TaxID=56615 RepID=A0A5B0Q046_PUCGR|nr:hypothetical protein PGT21_035336 [Puccinia graminis f. sp. tritici]KAA1126342.1 hypothetical protein PGTUg99_027744 [Puccinia graminis f. sp. tritici]